MASEAPPFWWDAPDWRSFSLAPFSAIYARIAGRMMQSARREMIGAPVLCIGNFTVGGTGKTPVAIALAKQAKRMRLNPGILSRGHGGGFSQPHIVDPDHDSAKHVGDEPLLLAEHAPVAVTPNRAAGARLLLEEHGCDFLIMDDGFQSARIHIDYALIVIDARYGVGNGRVIPGGPLRAKIVDQLVYTTAMLKMGEGTAADAVIRQVARAGRPIFEAHTRPLGAKALAGRQFLVFSGIGHPDKFFSTIASVGGTVAHTRAFPDHHFYAEDELQDLMLTADAAGLDLITTEKDAARLRHGAAPQDFLDRLTVLKIDVSFDLDQTPLRIIDETLDAWRQRRLHG